MNSNNYIKQDYIKHKFSLVIAGDNYLWRCEYCGVAATVDYAEKIGLGKLDIVEPCVVNAVYSMVDMN